VARESSTAARLHGARALLGSSAGLPAADLPSGPPQLTSASDQRAVQQRFRQEEEKKPTEVELLTEIRDELRLRP
jgi:hypothetical protein